MELLLLGALGYAGYTFNMSKTKKEEYSKRTTMIPNDIPNGDNIYTSNIVEAANNEILRKSTANYIKAQNPSTTGYISNTYNLNSVAQQIASTSNLPIDNKGDTRGSRVDFSAPLKPNEENIINKPMFNTMGFSNESNFSNFENTDTNLNELTGLPYEKGHGNMTPFFGSNVKQNKEHDGRVVKLYTGETSFYKKKKEVENFGNIEQQNIYGNKPVTEQEQERYITGRFRQGEKPFKEEKIAPNDYGVRPEYKSVDDLRVGSNPKISFEGRTIAGQFGNTRGAKPNVQKNSVPTDFAQTEDNYFKTTGARIAESAKLNFDIKKTSREDTTSEYTGNTYNPISFSQRLGKALEDSVVQEPKRQQFIQDTFRNVDGKKTFALLNKESYLPTVTEREINGENTHVSNTNYTSMGVRIQDDTYIPKNTVKETTIQSVVGNIKSDYGLSSNEETNWVPKNTTKETNIESKYIGIPERDTGMGYSVTSYSAKTTGRETILDNTEYNGAPSINISSSSRNAYENAEISDKKEVLLDSRASGPNNFQINAGIGAYGDTKLTNNMLLKENMGYRKNFTRLSNKTQDNLEQISTVNNNRLEIKDNRLDPSIIKAQLESNHFINKSFFNINK